MDRTNRAATLITAALLREPTARPVSEAGFIHAWLGPSTVIGIRATVAYPPVSSNQPGGRDGTERRPSVREVPTVRRADPHYVHHSLRNQPLEASRMEKSQRRSAAAEACYAPVMRR
jgi:hypothetical protein